ncbi:hypothetical protein GALMADRAFT_276573 [Galerina marginata CBS 339.88]|uniref:F-box domain-containing protein n=1 Tax=Galerina marginata (strain CBS 339.88) TaxID=685588 RepID=A0A067TSJ7_GALM3|nr:hypothetical protein GALMADRAFT_276573 [Galerina marginata CBS 339.88]
MERCSTRLPKQTQKCLAEEDFQPEEEQDEDDAPVPLTKVRNRKRKSNDEKIANQPPVKKVRGTRGILQKLVEMPLDVLFEIFGRLEPIDLLHLARTTKDIRTLLMSRSSVSIWKQARSNIPESLPECPDDLSEPQYADLAFGKCCHFCRRNLGGLHTVWSARIKACTKCLDEQFSDKCTPRWPTYRGYPSELPLFLPSIEVSKKSGRYSRVKDLYYVELDKVWKADYAVATDKEKWLKDKLAERKIITSHANACIAWSAKMQILREQQKSSAVNDRKAIVVQRLISLGWEEELSKMSVLDREPQDDPIVLKACQRELTERVLSNLEDFLNSFMQSVKSKRLTKERHALLNPRLVVLDKVLRTHISTLPANALHPSTSELFLHPTVQDTINNTPSTVDFTEDSFATILPMFPAITVCWQQKIEAQLLDLIRNAAPEYSFDPETVLQLATTSFTCSRPSCYPRHESQALRHPRVLMHSCATSAIGYQHEEDVDLLSVRSILRQVYWNDRQSISFNPSNLKLMAEVLEICGFDSKTTTAAEMDAANPILECVTCNNVYEGRATLTWSGVCAHNYQEHLSSLSKKMKLDVLNERDAETVRSRMSESQERLRASRLYIQLICVHCKRTGNTTELVKHFKKDHENRNPTDDDIKPLLDSYQIPCAYYLWPPREEVDEPEQLESVVERSFC